MRLLILEGYFCILSLIIAPLSYFFSILKLSYTIARRLMRQKGTSFSRFIIRLSTLATSISVAVMIIAIAVVLGFKTTIKDKMFVFWGQIQVTPFNPNPASIIAPNPFDLNDSLLNKMRSFPGVVSVDPYALRPAIIQADNIMEGIKIKGVNSEYSMSDNKAITFSGSGLSFSDTDYAHQIILSQTTLNRIDKNILDTVLVYFLNPKQNFPSIRKLQISGIYHTGMDEIDKNFAICDIQLLRKVGNWDAKAINGYQIAVDDYKKADKIGNSIYQKMLQPPMNWNSMEDIYPNIFSWLALMNTNAYIILIIMAIVAMINMATALLIFILERTNMVGILKTLGMPMRKIQNIFFFHSAIISLKGVLWGTLLGIGLCFLQYHFQIIKLNESAYYMQYVPIKIAGWQILLIDIATLLFCFIMMLLPLFIVRKINIIKAIRFK